MYVNNNVIFTCILFLWTNNDTLVFTLMQDKYIHNFQEPSHVLYRTLIAMQCCHKNVTIIKHIPAV